MLLLTTHQLTYHYGRQAAVSELDLAVPEGAIFGFIGPNGAGKSTTIKLLLGLLRPAGGRVTIFGRSLHEARQPVLYRIGSLIEAPSLYENLTAREHLRWLDHLFHQGSRRIDEVLELVDLHDAAEKQVKQFSMGMKQRLGIALALFHDPDLLVLDEPVNGLDPAGIQDMRRLFQRLKAAGKTLLISSHILAEVEKTATHVGIIQHGRLRFQGRVEELRASFRPHFRLRTSDDRQALTHLRAEGWACRLEADAGVEVAVDEGPDFHRLISTLLATGLELYLAEARRGTLEDLFLEMTRSGDTEPLATPVAG